MKRSTLIVVIMFACICLFFAGCSKEDVDVAFVTSMDTADENSSAYNCMTGVISGADSNKIAFKAYEGDTENSIDEAIVAGAEIIVLYGVDDEAAVYECAGKYSDTKFICVDFGNDFLVRANIQCINVMQGQCGVYAGYSAIKEGNTVVGIQGEETAETYNYIKGFIEGAQLAAVEIGVSKKPIKIYYNVSGSDMVVPRSKSWYENGCSLIFCSESVYADVYENISNSDMNSVMTFGAERVSEDERIIASAYSDYRHSVSNAITDAMEGNFKGGLMYTAGAGDKASGFTYDKAKYDILTESDLDKVTDHIAEYGLEDSYFYKKPSDKGYSKIVLSEVGIIANSAGNQ